MTCSLCVEFAALKEEVLNRFLLRKAHRTSGGAPAFGVVHVFCKGMLTSEELSKCPGVIVKLAEDTKMIRGGEERPDCVIVLSTWRHRLCIVISNLVHQGGCGKRSFVAGRL